MIRVLREEVADKGMISLSEITDRNWMIGFQRISGALTKGQWDPSTNDVLQTIMTKYGIKEGDIWELTPKKLEAIIDRNKTGLIGQEFGDFLERTGYAEAVYEAAYGLHEYKSMSGGMTMSAAEADVAAVNAEFAAQQKAKAPSNESVSEIKLNLDEIKVKTRRVEGVGEVDTPPAFKQTEFASSYEARYNQTPALRIQRLVLKDKWENLNVS